MKIFKPFLPTFEVWLDRSGGGLVCTYQLHSLILIADFYSIWQYREPKDDERLWWKFVIMGRDGTFLYGVDFTNQVAVKTRHFKKSLVKALLEAPDEHKRLETSWNRIRSNFRSEVQDYVDVFLLVNNL